jgi:hypothetical protein
VARSKKPPKKRANTSSVFREWCREFQAHNGSRARVVLQNILYDCKKGRLDKNTLKVFLTAFRESVGEQPAEALIGAIVAAKSGELLCRAKDTPRPALCSRVMVGADFLENNIQLRRLGLKIPVRDVAGAIKELQRGGLRGITKKSMRGRLPLAWVTKTDAIDTLRQQVPANRLANELRDQLGLNHLHGDQYLVEIVYPPGTPATLRAPTFLEGSDLVFRSVRGPDSWGRTVHLKTLKAGMPEAIHAPIPFTDRYSVRDVGRLSRSTGFTFDKLARWGGCAACTERRCACLIQARLAR